MEHRVEPLTGALEPGMYAGDFDWNDCLSPGGRSMSFHIAEPRFRFCADLLKVVACCLPEAIETLLLSG